jgi:hypothetical protein
MGPCCEAFRFMSDGANLVVDPLIIMPFPAIPVFDKATDKTFSDELLAAMDSDVLALCKYFKISSTSMTNLAADEFTSVQSYLNVKDAEDRDTVLACAQGGGSKIGLKRLLQRVTAGDLRVEVTDEPPKKRKKKSSAAVASTSAAAAPEAVEPDTDADSDEAEAENAVGFERSKVSSSLSLSLSLGFLGFWVRVHGACRMRYLPVVGGFG